MEPTRVAAVRLQEDGLIRILKGGADVQPPFRGPIRLALPLSSPSLTAVTQQYK